MADQPMRIVADCCQDPFTVMGETDYRDRLIVICRTCGTTIVEVLDGAE